jgi:ACR3 family arsenite transporter
LKPAPLSHIEFEGSILGQLSTLDRFLPVWIGVAMAIGLVLGRIFPGLNEELDRVKIDSTSLPIAIGLLGMMYPVLAKVRYDRLRNVTADRPLVLSSLLLNWAVGPALMFTLAWMFLPDLPEFRTGIILIGLARCIAMVLIWNALACGDGEAGAVLVVLNSVFQVAGYALLGYFYLELLPGWLGLDQTAVDFALWDIAKSVLIFLGVPLALGFLTSLIGRKRKGDEWYEQRFLPRIGPFALYSLLFTIVILFAIQGDAIASQPLDVARIAPPLLGYFALMWTAAFVWGRAQGLAYPKTATLAFTAAGNNFELAIAVAIGTFGIDSGQALAGVVGPLIEVPALVTLVYASLWAGKRFFGAAGLPAPARS